MNNTEADTSLSELETILAAEMLCRTNLNAAIQKRAEADAMCKAILEELNGLKRAAYEQGFKGNIMRDSQGNRVNTLFSSVPAPKSRAEDTELTDAYETYTRLQAKLQEAGKEMDRVARPVAQAFIDAGEWHNLHKMIVAMPSSVTKAHFADWYFQLCEYEKAPK